VSTDPNVAAASDADASGADTDPGLNTTGAPTTADVQVNRQGGIEEIIVTGQKKEERLQDVPIAISAFSPEQLDAQKIEGGFDLLRAIPNVTFSKTNYSGYNFSIRGVGTKAVSATSDPGVAVSFNSTSLIRNRLFEQEYLDVERVEVLRGPQGTLYGRNATAGVVNVITAKPDLHEFSGSLKAEAGNYDSRRMTGVVNVPLFDDLLALRVAAASTQRSGYGINLTTGNDVDGRDLWTGRTSLAFQPTDRLRADFIWEHFEEDDNRLRTGKQLCHRDPGPEGIPGVSEQNYLPLFRARLSQGCKPGSLYSPEAFGAPNGNSIPFIVAGQYSTIIGRRVPATDPSYNRALHEVPLLQVGVDPFGGTQSRNLRAMESFYDPEYRAEADIYMLDLSFELTDRLTLSSQTLYNEDMVYSFQDYHRFATIPNFNDSTGLYDSHYPGGGSQATDPSRYAGLVPNGVFADPQIGAADRILGFEISSSESTQFSQELRLASSFDGPLNFSVGANYTKFKGENEYYLFYNIVTAIAQIQYNRASNFIDCNNSPEVCLKIDPNPVGVGPGDGHNYFRNYNPYELESTAAFGELYWQASDEVKVTAGLRYTEDRKRFTPWPSQLMQAGYAYGSMETMNQSWGEFTGRLGVDWSPALAFTDQTLIYAFYSRGYKGGGANPPPAASQIPLLQTHSMTFDPEFVDAIEIGTKNTLLGGSLMLNGAAFFYDYQDYQVSKVVDRTVVNENFDARVWGAELEALWQPTAELRANMTLGYLGTRIGSGSRSIDIFDRTQGRDGWTMVTPWLQQTSNCILPTELVATFINMGVIPGALHASPIITSCLQYSLFQLDPENNYFAMLGYNPDDYPEINGGAGFEAELGGNELPNAPHWTFNFGADYTWTLNEGWEATLRGDYYRQGASYSRVYNTVSDRLRGWDNVNVALRFSRPDSQLTFEIYAKNVLDDTPITDAFLNSDSTGMTTNIFTLDPRLVGVSVRVGF
jgi:outer membrane receptor protein involved in Fe transport